MKPLFWSILIQLFFVGSCFSHGQDVQHQKPLTLLAFGSCNRTDLDQGIWESIAHESADLWVWLGDIVYTKGQSMADLAAKYTLQKGLPAYQRLMKQSQVLGVWDDHDFGKNDAGSAFEKKQQSRELLFDFLELDYSHPARSRKGAYQSYTFGTDSLQVMLILLDVRYFKEAYVRNPSSMQRYKKDPDGLLLGAAQWEWLEALLAESRAKVHVFGGGIQLLSPDHPFEKWANYPQARKRFMALLEKYEIKNPIYLSGDRHIAELSAQPLAYGATLYDFTSSGLTHAYTGLKVEENPFRISHLIKELNYGLLGLDWEEEKIELILKGKAGQVLYQHEIEMQ